MMVMKKIQVSLVLMFLSTFTLGCDSKNSVTEVQNKSTDSLNIDGYKLVWNDEFDVAGKPDDTKWGYDIGGNGWGNNELQYYTEDSVNVRVNNGNLEIEVHYYPNLDINYTSARLVTKNKGDWKYGRIEVRAKIPAGLGSWPAIWMLPTDWEYGGWPASGEIDIMEHVGYDQNNIHGSVHTESYNHKIGTQKSNQIVIPSASTEFHTYAVEWEAEKIDFFVDEQKYFSFANEHKSYSEWPFDKRFHLILNIAFGGNWGGAQGIDNSIFPIQMDVDYVRVYEKE